MSDKLDEIVERVANDMNRADYEGGLLDGLRRVCAEVHSLWRERFRKMGIIVEREKADLRRQLDEAKQETQQLKNGQQILFDKLLQAEADKERLDWLLKSIAEYNPQGLPETRAAIDEELEAHKIKAEDTPV